MKIGRFLLMAPVAALVIWGRAAFAGGNIERRDADVLRRFLSHVEFVEESDGAGGFVPTLRISGINVQIVNGQGSTESANGSGNLILGYNESGHPGGDVRTGSHSLVFGVRANYEGWGNCIGGADNWIAGNRSVALSGLDNYVGDDGAVIVTGIGCRIAAPYGLIGTGFGSEVTGIAGACLGGASASASGDNATVVGGFNGAALGAGSVVGGGLSRSALGTLDWVAGSLFEDQ